MSEEESNESRPMTPEYASLSFRAGVVAATADQFLHSLEYSLRIRRDKWNLSEQYILDLKDELLARGMPDSLLAYAETFASKAIISPQFQFLMEAQAVRDKIWKKSTRSEVQ